MSRTTGIAVALLLVCGLGAHCQPTPRVEPSAATAPTPIPMPMPAVSLRDDGGAFSLELPVSWRRVDNGGIAAYMDPAEPQYTFWIASEHAARSEQNARLFQLPASGILDELLAGSPVKPEILRYEVLAPGRALAFARPTLFVEDGTAQYSWSLVDLQPDGVHITVGSLSVADAQLETPQTEGLLQLLWTSMSQLRLQAVPAPR